MLVLSSIMQATRKHPGLEAFNLHAFLFFVLKASFIIMFLLVEEGVHQRLCSLTAAMLLSCVIVPSGFGSEFWR